MDAPASEIQANPLTASLASPARWGDVVDEQPLPHRVDPFGR
jgi:hypothetical protein